MENIETYMRNDKVLGILEGYIAAREQNGNPLNDDLDKTYIAVSKLGYNLDEAFSKANGELPDDLDDVVREHPEVRDLLVMALTQEEPVDRYAQQLQREQEGGQTLFCEENRVSKYLENEGLQDGLKIDLPDTKIMDYFVETYR
jgi:hypothetical protein